MADLIDRQAALNVITRFYPGSIALDAIQNLPSAERKGKWIRDGVAYSLYKCTACNDLCAVAGWANCIPEEQMYKSFKFCPHCGARMESES